MLYGELIRRNAYLDCVGVLGLRGVKGLACGFSVNFFAFGFNVLGLSFDDETTEGGVESLLLPALELTLLLLLFTLFTLCGVVAWGGVELGPCDLSACGVDDGVGWCWMWW